VNVPGSPSGSGLRVILGDPQGQAGTGRAAHAQHPLTGVGAARWVELPYRRAPPIAASPVPVRGPEAHHDLLDPQALGAGGERAHDAVELGQRHLDHRPDVEQHAVPRQPPEVGVGGAGGAQAVQRGVEHGLHLRQGPDAPGVVAQDGQVAHVAGDDQPAVLGDVAAARVEQVDVGGRGQAGELEVAQAPEAEPFGDHGVQAAQGAVLDRETER
jgi:hypothetical protein